MKQQSKPEITNENDELDLSNMPVEAAVAKMVEHAGNMRASDLFINSNEENVEIACRHLGMIKHLATVPLPIGRRYMAHIKAMASLDISEKRHPMDGRWLQRQTEGDDIDLRINTIPTLYGEDFTLRILIRSKQLFHLDQLGLLPSQAQGLNTMLSSPSGMILITGPTGSGKTATQYSCVIALNDGQKKINTIEDPIEYSIEGIRQSQINPQIKLGFAELLRSVMRQSPDVIMIGEIRDAETAETAVRAANSGHLVFATLHAPVAAAAIQAMRSFNVHPHFLSTSLLGVVSQRLVRTLCNDCKQAFDLLPGQGTFDEVKPWLEPGYGHTLYAPRGCPKCGSSGYAGRSGVFEIMAITRDIHNLIAEGRPTREIRDKAIRDGMIEFRHSALLKVARGETSTEEVFRVIPSEYLLLDD